MEPKLPDTPAKSRDGGPPSEGQRGSPGPTPLLRTDSPAASSSAEVILVPPQARQRVLSLIPESLRQPATLSAAASSDPGLVELVLPLSFIASKRGKEALKTLIFEVVVSDLAAFAQNGVLPVQSKDRLSKLLLWSSGKPVTSDLELRTSISAILHENKSNIGARIKDRSRSLSQFSKDVRCNSLRQASRSANELLATLTELRALSWIAPDVLSHLTFCERGESALENTVGTLSEFARGSLVHRDYEAVSVALSLLGQINSVLQQGRLDRHPDPCLLPLPAVPKDRPRDPAAALRALQKGPAGASTSFLAKFAPALMRELPTRISGIETTLGMIQEAAAWTSEDPQPGSLLLDQMIDIIPEAAKDLAQLKENPSGLLGPGFLAFVRHLSLLRFHGENDGLAAFVGILNPQEAPPEGALETQPTGNPERDLVVKGRLEELAIKSTPAWIDLLCFAGDWGHLNPSRRVDGLRAYHQDLSACVARSIGIMCEAFRSNVEQLLDSKTFCRGPDLQELIRSVAQLSDAAAEISPHLGAEARHVFRRIIVDETCPSLIRSLKALELPDRSAPELLRRASALPSDFGDSPLEQKLAGFCASLRAEAASTGEEFAVSTLQALERSLEKADPGVFSASLDAFLALLPLAPPSSPLWTSHLASAADLSTRFTNVIAKFGQDSLKDLSPREGAELDAESAAALREALWFQLASLAPLRSVIKRHVSALKQHQLFHVENAVITACNAHPSVTVATVAEAVRQLESNEPQEALRIAQLLADLPQAISRLIKRGDCSLEDLRHFIAQSEQRTAGLPTSL